MSIVLGPNQYGKAENRVVRITRDTGRHEITDLNVSTSLRGAFADAHVTGARTSRHSVDEILPAPTLFDYGFQHMLAFYAGAVIVPILLASAIGLTQDEAEGEGEGEDGAGSLMDQSTLGRTRLDGTTHDELVDLSGQYCERFGFPLVTCVRDRNASAQVLRNGWERRNNSKSQEHAAALIEITKIAAYRFDDLVTDASPILSARLRITDVDQMA